MRDLEPLFLRRCQCQPESHYITVVTLAVDAFNSDLGLFVWYLLSPPLIRVDMADQLPAQTAKKSRSFLKNLKKVFRPGSQSNPPGLSNTPVAVFPGSNMPPTIANTATPSADIAPIVPTTNPEEAAKLRAKYTHFRILVIGRANAGKTTLLKRVCNTKEDPVYNAVRYQLCLKTCSYRPCTNRSTPHQRYTFLPYFLIKSLTGAVARDT